MFYVTVTINLKRKEAAAMQNLFKSCFVNRFRSVVRFLSGCQTGGRRFVCVLLPVACFGAVWCCARRLFLTFCNMLDVQRHGPFVCVFFCAQKQDERTAAKNRRRDRMQKLIPDNKLSKKARKALAQQKRKDWGGLSPVTRKPESPKAYRRSQQKQWMRKSGY